MNAQYFEKLVAWQKGKPNTRFLSVELKPNLAPQVWAYDTELQVGEFLSGDDIPNLEVKAEEVAKAEYERLKARFEDEDR